MSRHFKTITTVELGHSYYADGKCRDILLQPTLETTALLRKLRMQWGSPEKKIPSKYQLVQERVDANTPLIPIPNDLELRFEMRLHQASLLNFTDFGAQGEKSANEVYVFENQSSGTSLTGTNYIKARLVGEYLDLDGLLPNSTISVSTPSGSPLLSATADVNGEARISVAKLTSGERIQPGLYVVGYTDTANMAKELHIYKDSTLIGSDPFGILHLQHGGGKSILHDFSHQFVAKSAIWRYYVLPLETGIVDTAIPYTINSSTPTFTPYLHAVTDPTGEVLGQLPAELKALMQMCNYTQAIEFVATAPLQYSEVPRTNITLTRTVSSSTRTIATHLPNPPAGKPSPAVIVKVTA